MGIEKRIRDKMKIIYGFPDGAYFLKPGRFYYAAADGTVYLTEKFKYLSK